MELSLRDNSVLRGYKSNSQKARVFSEKWLASEMYCPICLNNSLNQYSNNKEAADFFCSSCSNRYQLKASSKRFNRKIIDGEYNTFLWHVKNRMAPNFFLMEYSSEDWYVENLIIIPKYFISTELIEKRNPLRGTARRNGWTGCNILIHSIPIEAKVPIILNKKIQNRESINKNLKKYSFLEKEKHTQVGWISDVLFCIEKTKKDVFELSDLYRFNGYLKRLHPTNNHIEEKIRQQLQLLRDRKIIEFLGNGKYRKTDHQ